jgi:LmbE family N-acetylglucosaminyl deacetylase
VLSGRLKSNKEVHVIRPERVVGIFAHPDDEVFCAGGTIAKWAAAGSEATVVSATRGETGQIRDSTIASRRTLGQVREQELRKACERLGAAGTITLDHVDGQLAEVAPDVLIDEITTLLDELRPDAVITFGHDGAYGHPDHVAIGIATIGAVDSLKKRHVAAPVLLRSHFPARSMSLAQRLAEWLVSIEGRFDGSGAYGRALTLFAEESTTMRFASDDVRIEWFPPGSMIVEQGEPATSLCLILSGTVDVVQEHGDSTQLMRQLGEGHYFGELGLTRGRPRSASVIANGNVTCLVLSPNRPTKYAGRGAAANTYANIDGLGSDTRVRCLTTSADGGDADQLVTIDVSDFVGVKVAALAAHRSQYPIEPEMFPASMLIEMYGYEHFIVSNQRAAGAVS